MLFYVRLGLFEGYKSFLIRVKIVEPFIDDVLYLTIKITSVLSWTTFLCWSWCRWWHWYWLLDFRIRFRYNFLDLWGWFRYRFLDIWG